MANYAQAPTGITTSQDFAALEPVVLSRAREVAERDTLLTSSSVVTRITMPQGQGRRIHIPRFTQRWVARNIQEGQPINNPQRLLPDVQSFTTYEIGLDFIATDQTEWYMPEQILARAGRMMGAAIKRRQEEDMLSLFQLPTRTLGAPGNVFNPNWLAAASMRLQVNTEIFPYDPATKKPLAVLHRYQVYPILQLSGTIGSNAFSGGRAPITGWTEKLIQQFDIRELYGQAIAYHDMIPIDANDDATGCVFTPDAFLYIQTSRSFFTERERDISLRATLITATSHYGVGYLDDQFAIRIVCDASLPV